MEQGLGNGNKNNCWHHASGVIACLFHRIMLFYSETVLNITTLYWIYSLITFCCYNNTCPYTGHMIHTKDNEDTI